MKFLIGLILFFGVLAFGSPNAHACECEWPSVQEAYDSSSAVFIGTFNGFVEKSADGRKYNALKFKVERKWKGNLANEIILDYFDLEGQCDDLDFINERKYLIYVSVWDGNPILVVDCGRSRELKYGAKDIQILKKLKT
jgi:hypothetical protein